MHRQLLLATALVLPVAASPALAQEDAKQGGSMIVTYKDDVSTLDPAIGYDWQNWSMIKSLFDGLMDYAPGTTELIPDLAESYELSEDGLTYTFKLRDGVKFHNGRELTADDVKWSIERVVRPETQSPGQGFFGMIAGFDEVAAGEAQELSGIEVVDPHTIRFTLSRPDATFLHVMALNFSFAVPKEEVEKYGQDFGKQPGRHRRLSHDRLDARPARRVSSATPTTTAKACPSSTRSPSRSARSRWWPCCGCSAARSTSWATASRRPSSSRSWTTPNGAAT